MIPLIPILVLLLLNLGSSDAHYLPQGQLRRYSPNAPVPRHLSRNIGSVFDTRSHLAVPRAVSSAAVTSLGCYSDSSSSRTLNGTSTTFPTSNSPAACQAFCQGKGYLYAGTEYSTQCWCGNTLSSTRSTDSTTCSYTCSGNKTLTCGGYNAINVYALPGAPVSSSKTSTVAITTPAASKSTTAATTSKATSKSSAATTTSKAAAAAPVVGSTSKVTTTTMSSAVASASAAPLFYLGCFKDSASSRLLSGPSVTSPHAMTPTFCSTWCSGQGYTYSGVESSTQCFCGKALDTSQKTTEASCTWTCAGNSSLICGGSYLLNIYSSVAPAVSSSAVATTSKVSSTKSIASGTSASASASASVSASASAKPLTYLGCYKDSSTRTLNGTSLTSPHAMTPSACSTYCTGQGYIYSGTESSSQCFCGNYLDATQKTTNASCTWTCTGDSTLICGGSYLLSVYSTSNQVTTTSIAPSATSSVASPNNSGGVSCVGTCASVIGVEAPPASGGSKVMYAHHMVGNTYSYTQATWADDISLASAAGIDAFALNFGSDYWQPASLDYAYAAAEASGNFKLMLSLDVTSLSCGSTADAANLASIIASHANSSAQATYGGKTMVSTFSGDYCSFGQPNVTAGWTYLRTLLAAQNVTMHLVPALFSDPASFASMTWFDGEFNWNSGWPTGAAAGSDLTTASDVQYMGALPGRTYMPAISPCFFTYYGPNSYNKDWTYRGDGWLLASRLEQIVQMRASINIAEIISWNDYGESHYIGPIRADQPNSQGWTNGMPHTGWLDLIAYYLPAYKTGVYPTPNTDSMFLWTRPHPKAATPTAPTNARPTNWQDVDDNLYAVVILTAPASVTISSGNNTGTWNLPSGLSKLSVSSAPGSISGSIVRSKKTVKSYDSTGTFSYVAVPTDYNYNYFVASA